MEDYLTMQVIDLPLNGVFAQHEPMPMLLCAFLMGIFAGLFCDVAGTSQRFFGKNTVILFIADLFCVITIYLLLFACALDFCDGIIRWYHILIIFAGYKFYLKAFSRTVNRILLLLSKLVLTVCSVLFAVVSFPAKIMFRVLSGLIEDADEVLHNFINKRSFNKHRKKYLLGARDGFGVTESAYYEKGENEKNGKQKSRKIGRNSHPSGAGISDNSLLQAANGSERVERRA